MNMPTFTFSWRFLALDGIRSGTITFRSMREAADWGVRLLDAFPLASIERVS